MAELGCYVNVNPKIQQTWNVATEMFVHIPFIKKLMNRFYENPKDDIVVEVDEMFNVCNGVIGVGIEEVQAVISGADNVIVLTGKANGANRLADSIEDAVLHLCQTAPGFDLFSATKVILKIRYPNSTPLMMAEMADISQFADMFKPSCEFIWGISEMEARKDYINVQIIATNLKKKI